MVPSGCGPSSTCSRATTCTTPSPRRPLLVVSGELDHPALRADAFRLVDALGEGAELLSIPGLAHPLADEPGIEPAPQQPLARAVDAGLTTWFRRHLADTR
jgi:hypothetical protein